MVIAPAKLGGYTISRDELAEDKKKCVKIGPVGFGEKAVYLSSFYVPRCYYASWIGIRRIFKRVAMSKGGYTGQGVFGATAYLVVQFSDGTEKQCNFKFETVVDDAIKWVEKNHPDVRTHSADAEKRLEAARKLEEGRYLKQLSPEAEKTVNTLMQAEQYLEEKPEYSGGMAEAAGTKRVQDNISVGRRILGCAIFAVSAAALAAGIYFAVQKTAYWIYLILFGVTFMFFSLSGNLVPIGRNSGKKVNSSWQRAVEGTSVYIRQKYAEYGDSGEAGSREVFPVPSRYAHPIVIKRMIRVIREGRAQTAEEALDAVKEELRKLNKSVKVSQEEYDEIVAVKPLFLVSEYK